MKYEKVVQMGDSYYCEPTPDSAPVASTKALSMGIAKTESMQQEYRRDGWPLCPRCGDDELYSLVIMQNAGKVPGPTLDECFAGEFRCYYCNWQGKIEPQKAA